MVPDIQFKLRGVYNFDVYPSALLGTSYSNVTILAVMDPTSAAKEIDIQALHVQAYPTLPAGTPNDPAGYDYVKILLTSGRETILGIAWINASTVNQVLSNVITATIANVSAADIPRIMNALVQNGYNNVKLSVTQ